MRIAIMQPYFFPYIGYFQLINAVDRFIIGDDVQYIKEGWISRNRVLKPGADGSYYIQIPIVKHSSKEIIKNIRAVDGCEWKKKIIRQIDHYKRAPYFSAVSKLLAHCFNSTETNVTRLNAMFLKEVCDYIGINFKVEIQSEMNFDYSLVTDTCERPIQMCLQLGATEYINPIGGSELYDRERFREKNLGLSFMCAGINEYNQNRNGFEPGLSILDVMMFNSTNDIKSMLNQYQLV